jgi:HEAT repeat protein
MVIQQTAIESLGVYGREAPEEAAVVQVLLNHLMNQTSLVREMAAWSLGELGTKVATDDVKSALLQRLSDPDTDPRKAAANSLGRFQRNGIRMSRFV